MVLESIGGLAARYGYTWTTELADGAMALDLEGQEDTTFTDVATFASQLKTWARGNTPLLMRCRFAPFDNINVKLEQVPLQPITLDENVAAGVGREKHYAAVTVLEL